MTRRAVGWALATVVGACVLLLAPTDGGARVGGGQSYSGGSSSGSNSSYGGSSSSYDGSSSSYDGSSSSYGGGDSYSSGSSSGGNSEFNHPVIFAILLLSFAVVGLAKLAEQAAYKVDPSTDQSRPVKRPRARMSNQLAALRKRDPNFSRFLFSDFAVLLFARFHEARSDGGDFHALAPYIQGSLYERLSKVAANSVSEVVVGAFHINRVKVGSVATIEVTYEASYLEDGQRRYAREAWRFRRKSDVLSPPPERATRLGCPQCGAAAELDVRGTCSYCKEVVNTGHFGWIVTRMSVQEVRALPRVDVGLDPGGVEVGTRKFTVYQRGLEARRRAFQARNPRFSQRRFIEFARETFLELQRAWSSRQWDLARPLETDNLFQTHRFWIERYQRDGLHNRLEDIQIDEVEMVRFEPDPFYETITLRIFATMTDYTVEEKTGRLVGGNRDTARTFSEYWTFIRWSDVQEKTLDRMQCPSCGASMQLNAAGVCAHCTTKITSGEFGWVLGLIEQDESYTG